MSNFARKIRRADPDGKRKEAVRAERAASRTARERGYIQAFVERWRREAFKIWCRAWWAVAYVHTHPGRDGTS